VNDQDAKEVVARGFDVIAERYVAWTQGLEDNARHPYELVFRQLVPTGGRVLDLGCGSAATTTKVLAEDYDVTGVDFSPRSIELARAALPRATFLHADMTDVSFPDASFDGVVAMYSIIHVPRAEQFPLLQHVRGWLRPGGTLVATLSARGDAAVVDPDWLGVEMYWSGFDADTNRRLVRDAGFTLRSDRVETSVEHGKETEFLWVVAQRPEA
jgi:ubiquinone/menaquinone biosynthesis C-methylase UbiE